MNVAATANMQIPQNQWEEIVDMLRNELSEYGEFMVLLDRQQKSILKQDADGLKDLDGIISNQISLTQSVRTKREDMTSTFAELIGLPKETTLRQLLPNFPEPVIPMVEALIDEINALVAKTRRLLRQNHLLLSRATEVAEKILSALNPAPTTKTYVRSGAVEYKSTNVGSCFKTSA